MASREPLIEPFQPYEEPGYDYDYDDDVSRPEPSRGGAPRVLWGRIGILAAALLFAFLIGRASAPDGIPAADLANARADLEAAEQEAEQLRDQLATIQTSDAGPDAEKEDEASDEGGGAAEEETGDTGSQTYAIKDGDTLSTIAERFYGDAGLADYIAAANPSVNPYALHVGQEIVIPAAPEDSQ